MDKINASLDASHEWYSKLFEELDVAKRQAVREAVEHAVVSATGKKPTGETLKVAMQQLLTQAAADTKGDPFKIAVAIMDGTFKWDRIDPNNLEPRSLFE